MSFNVLNYNFVILILKCNFDVITDCGEIMFFLGRFFFMFLFFFCKQLKKTVFESSERYNFTLPIVIYAKSAKRIFVYGIAHFTQFDFSNA